MALIQGVVQDPFVQTGGDSVDAKDVLVGKQREQLVSPISGPLYTANLRSRVFHGSQLPAGAAPALWSATTQQCGLFNPLGSGRNLVLNKLTATYVSGTGIVNGFALGYVTGAGATIATGAPVITAATTIAAKSGKLDGAIAKGVFMSAGITTAAPTYLTNVGLAQLVITAADATNVVFPIIREFDGEVIIPPGTAIFVSANITGITSVYSFSLVWTEVNE